MSDRDEPAREHADPGALLRQDVLRIFRAGAVGAAIFAIVVGVVEYLLYGLEYWGSVVTSTGTGIMAGLFFLLSRRGKDLAASWVLIVGVWFMILIDTAFQAGSSTHGVVALPLLVLVAVWLTGSAVATYALAIGSTLALLLVELLFMYGVIEPQGISPPLVGVTIVGLILTLSAYIALRIYRSHLERLYHQQTLSESLAESEHDTRLILDNSMDPYYRADQDGVIVLMSPSIERIMGYTAAELIGTRLESYYADPQKRQEFLSILQANDGEIENFETPLVHKDGHVTTLSTSSRYWRDRDGNILGVEGNVRDVTHLKELQEKVERAGRIEVLDQLSGGLAHNFNNLLAIIQGNAELIRQARNDPREVDRLLTMIDQATERGVDLTRRMMAFSSHSVSAERTGVNVNELIETIGPMIRTSFSRDVELEMQLAEDVGATECHAGELEDAIINLALNARDAVGDKGHVIIRTGNIRATAEHALNPDFTGGDCVAITVEDDGEGIPEHVAGKVIEPFFTAKARNRGTGLGLSMVYGLVRRLDGDLRLKSEAGGGTSVTLLLPRSGAEPAKASGEPSQSPTVNRSARILVAEDEPQLRELAASRLRELGYEPVMVESGVEAKAFLESGEHVDLVFSDIVMPGGISGFDLVDIVRQLRPGVPILLCTGYAGAAGREEHSDVPVLNKPFRTVELAAALDELLESTSDGH